MHTTSLNISQEIFEQLEKSAFRMNIPVTLLIKRLIARFSKRYTERLEYAESSVVYQPQAKRWHVFVITFTDEEYEQILDIRKVWKVSVSFFVIMAFLHYLYCSATGDEYESRRFLTNSYMLTKYQFEKKIIKNTMTFILIWGDVETPT